MSIATEISAVPEEKRTQRLKAATHAAHERLDKRIMQVNPFTDRESYGRFVTMQYLFHRDLDALFFNQELGALLPDLSGRRRLTFIEQDLADLGIAVPQSMCTPTFTKGDKVALGVCLGWLYVIEGSNLGAAFLLKYAAKLGLDETMGARHLAGAPEGRGLHWRTFTAALDSVKLSDGEERAVIDGADAAFARVYDFAEFAFSER